jgi:biotin operon repressor
MKIRVYDSDGEYKGGLFKAKSFTASNCRTWQGPPHPHYSEMLIDIAGKGIPCHEGSWFRLQLAAVPEISGPPDGSDDFDDNSRAYRISASEAAAWLERNAFPIPADLREFIRGETGALAGADGGSVAGPLPDGMAEVWAALQGKLLTAKQLGQALGITAEAVRKRIKQLNERHHAVKNTRGAGYYRPDAPPPELAPPRAADRTSG